MSKPTMQVEELRSFARKMDELMPRRADLVREAADTIMRLRDDLQTQREVATDNTNRNAREYKRVCDENDKLRELVRRYSEYTDQDRCEGCVYKSRCNDGYVDECWQLTEIRRLARELGIEVPE